MLANVSSNDLTVLRIGMSEDVLDEVVAILVTRNVDEWNTGTIHTPLADSIEIAAQEFGATNLEALFNDLGSKLVHRVLRCVPNHMIDGTATVCRSTVLTNVLDTPIAELAVSHNVDVQKNFLDAGTLLLNVISGLHTRV